MFPIRFDILGAHVDIWDLMLLAGLAVGYVVLRSVFRLPARGPLPHVRLLFLRYAVTAYLAVIAAQLFSYAFDLGTTLRPPRTMSWAYYYLSPTAGAKTLYGAVAALPFAVFLVSTPWRDLRYGDALDRWTAALFAVLAVARVGCFLQGCCYGVRSQLFGVSFPPGSVVYNSQLQEGLITAGAPALPVVPTQMISALVLVALCAWTYRRIAAGQTRIFPDALAAYSLYRLVIEFVRGDPARNQLGPLSTSQWIALIVLGGYGLWLRVLSPWGVKLKRKNRLTVALPNRG